MAESKQTPQPKWNAPLKVRRMVNHGAHAMDGSGWQWEITDRHGELIADKLLREQAEFIVEACNGYAALQAQNAELVKALEDAETAVRDDATKYSVWPNGEYTLLKIADGLRAALAKVQGATP